MAIKVLSEALANDADRPPAPAEKTNVRSEKRCHNVAKPEVDSGGLTET